MSDTGIAPHGSGVRSRCGSALITVLWLIAALGIMGGISMSAARLGVATTRNRLELIRAAWAREACHEILLARYADDVQVRLVDTIDLGRQTWCRAVLSDAGAKIDLNALTTDEWRVLLGNDTLADAVLDWCDTGDVERPLGAERSWYHARGRRLPRNSPLASVSELQYVRGFDSSRVQALGRLGTVRGVAQVDLNSAPAEVLRVIPGLTPETVEVILGARTGGAGIAGPEDLLRRLSPPARTELLDRYSDFLRRVSFGPVRFIEYIEGGIRGTTIVSRGWLTVVPTARRLAVVRREME